MEKKQCYSWIRIPAIVLMGMFILCLACSVIKTAQAQDDFFAKNSKIYDLYQKHIDFSFQGEYHKAKKNLEKIVDMLDEDPYLSSWYRANNTGFQKEELLKLIAQLDENIKEAQSQKQTPPLKKTKAKKIKAKKKDKPAAADMASQGQLTEKVQESPQPGQIEKKPEVVPEEKGKAVLLEQPKGQSEKLSKKQAKEQVKEQRKKQQAEKEQQKQQQRQAALEKSKQSQGKLKIIANKWRGYSPFKVSFKAIAPGKKRIIAYHWDFADGDTSTQKNPVNTFYSGDYSSKIFQVKLEVAYHDGSVENAQADIEVLNK